MYKPEIVKVIKPNFFYFGNIFMNKSKSYLKSKFRLFIFLLIFFFMAKYPSISNCYYIFCNACYCPHFYRNFHPIFMHMHVT